MFFFQFQLIIKYSKLLLILLTDHSENDGISENEITFFFNETTLCVSKKVKNKFQKKYLKNVFFSSAFTWRLNPPRLQINTPCRV